MSLDKYKGHVCIVVNVASKWGKTAVNYQQLVALQQKVSENLEAFILFIALVAT